MFFAGVRPFRRSTKSMELGALEPLAVNFDEDAPLGVEPAYGAAGYSDETVKALEALEQGVVFWNDARECEYSSERASELLELGYQPLTPGETLSAFLDRCVSLGGLDPQARDGVIADFHNEGNFTYTQVTHSGAVILVCVRRIDDGWASTLTNITEFQEAKGALAAARQRADEIENEMRAELERLHKEKSDVEARQAELIRLIGKFSIIQRALKD